MKKYLLLICIIVLGAHTLTAQDINKKFDVFKKQYIEVMLKMSPEYATMLGNHKYDGLLYIPSQAQRDKQVKFNKNWIDSLHVYNINQLSNANKIDYHLIENQCNYSTWYINDFRTWEWDPREYKIFEPVAYMLTENYKPLDARLLSIGNKLKNISAYYRQAKLNIKNPTKEHTALAIEQFENSIPIIETDLLDSLAKSKLPQITKNYIKRNADSAVVAMKDFVAFLKNLKNDNPRNFRIEGDLYKKQFQYEIQSQYSIDEIYAAAVQRKEYLHTEMEKLAKQLWPVYMGNDKMPENRLELIKKVIDAISVKHTKPELFQQTIEKQLPELTAFVKEKNLVYMDPSKPLQVRKEPEYMAGVAGASMSSPGPYEKGVSAWYNVGTLNGWSAEKAESYLREYNDYVLQILNIHEAIPGHYVQFIYSNKAPSIVKSVLTNGAMVEGWAVYSELMMLENGYGGNTPEMWLMYYKWNLRSTCNTILDISVHTKKMSKEDATNLLVKEAFQQQTEAEGKWHRVQITSVQLTSYFTGFHEIVQLREAYKKKMGNTYNLKAFNEKFLSYGSAPVKYIRDLMLK